MAATTRVLRGGLANPRLFTTSLMAGDCYLLMEIVRPLRQLGRHFPRKRGKKLRHRVPPQRSNLPFSSAQPMRDDPFVPPPLRFTKEGSFFVGTIKGLTAPQPATQSANTGL